MKTKKFTILILAVLLINACKKDPLNNIFEDSSWNHERGIKSLVMDNQIGNAIIVSSIDESTVTVILNTDADPNISAVTINYLGLSWGASASVSSGSVLNFDNPDMKTVITITSGNGQTKDWTIIAEEFSNPVYGEWHIIDFKYSWDDYFGWGNKGDNVDLVNKLPESGAGLDDIISFGAVEGVKDDMLYGTYKRTAGTDAEFATYEYNNVDWSPQFGQLEHGTGKYYLTENANGHQVVKLVMDSGNKFTTGIIEITGENTLKVNLDATMRDLKLIDWSNYYSTWSSFVTCIGSYYNLQK